MKKTIILFLGALILFVKSVNAQGFPFPSEKLPEWGRPIENSLISELRLSIPIWLVQARAVNLTPNKSYNGQYNTVTWKITHVYVGIEGVNGTTFKTSAAPDFHGLKVLNPKLNELALYCVRPRLDATSPSVSDANRLFANYFSYNFPIQQSNPTFAQALAYAQSIERVAKADRNEQIRLLGVYAKSPMPQRSAWAISTLAESGLESAPKFLLDLTSAPKISIAGLLALDQGLEALDEGDKARWNDTSNRFNLWRRLVTSPASEEDAISIVNGLLQIGRDESRARDSAKVNKKTYTPFVGGARLFEWLRLAGANAKWTPQARAFAIANIGQLSRGELISRASAWTYLIRLAKSHPDFAAPTKTPSAKTNALSAELAEGAFSGLADLRPFTPTETATLRALQARAKSRRVKMFFDSVLQKPR